MLRYLVAALLTLWLSAPAAAFPIDQHVAPRDLAAGCVRAGYNASINGDGSATCTNTNCDGKGGSCAVSCDKDSHCEGSTPSISIHLQGMFGAAPTAMAPPEDFPLGHVSIGQVQGACRAVPGALFLGGTRHYMCLNPHCDPGIGPCYVDCDLSLCTAGMPHRPDERLTLVAILQAGKGVLHGNQLEEDGTTKSSPAPEAPKAPPMPIIQ